MWTIIAKILSLYVFTLYLKLFVRVREAQVGIKHKSDLLIGVLKKIQTRAIAIVRVVQLHELEI